MDQFDFDLPEAHIALRPARPREAARLLYAPRAGGLFDHVVADAPAVLRPGDLLVVNDTRVIPARLVALRRARGDGAGVRIETLLHKREDERRWRAFLRPLKRARVGDVLHFGQTLEAEIEAREDGEALLRFSCEGPALDAAIAAAGEMPLPPYIGARRAADERDAEDYQTMFAARPGAVAAPTAGLHFTEALMARIAAAGVRTAAITLHVGAGTFLPVKEDDPARHRMHAEWRAIDAQTAAAVNAARREGRRVVAVGTTVLRALESAADEAGMIEPTIGETAIFIRPGYRFRAVDALWTNFHLPRSTLFMLVAAFIGLERAHAAYAHAIKTGYRFYSYGDACLFERADALRGAA